MALPFLVFSRWVELLKEQVETSCEKKMESFEGTKDVNEKVKSTVALAVTLFRVYYRKVYN